MLNFIIHTFFERRYTNYYFLNILNSDASKHIKTKHSWFLVYPISWLLLTSMLTLLVSHLLKLSEPYEKFLCSSYENTEKIVWNCYTRICIRRLVSWCNNFFLLFFVKHLINYPTYLNLKEMFLLYSFFNSDSGNSNSRQNKPSGRSLYLYWTFVAFFGVFSFMTGAMAVEEGLTKHPLVFIVGVAFIVLSTIFCLLSLFFKCLIIRYSKKSNLWFRMLVCVILVIGFYVFYLILLGFLYFLLASLVPPFVIESHTMLEGNIRFLSIPYEVIKILFKSTALKLPEGMFNGYIHFIPENFGKILEGSYFIYLCIKDFYRLLFFKLLNNFSEETIFVIAVETLFIVSVFTLPYEGKSFNA